MQILHLTTKLYMSWQVSMAVKEQTWLRSSILEGGSTGRLLTCESRRIQTGFAWRDAASIRFQTNTSWSLEDSQHPTRRLTTVIYSIRQQTTLSSLIARQERSLTSTRDSQRLAQMVSCTALKRTHLTCISSTWMCSSGTSSIESSSDGEKKKICFSSSSC